MTFSRWQGFSCPMKRTFETTTHIGLSRILKLIIHPQSDVALKTSTRYGFKVTRSLASIKYPVKAHNFWHHHHDNRCNRIYCKEPGIGKSK